MEFWGIEVKAKPINVELEPGHCIHISQATLGELKKDNEPVTVHIKVGDQKFVLGFLSQNSPQLSFDLAFNDSFEISHNWKNGSVHLLGYQSDMQDDEDDDFDSSDEDIPMPIPLENGKPAAAKAAEKQNKDNKLKAEVKPENEDDDDSEEDDSEDDDDSDADMLEGSDDSDEEEGSEDDDDSEDETPAKAEIGKKRKPDAKTPEPKKAKLATPQKTDGKKGGHTATPHPAKKGGKTPGGEKSAPKGSQVSCGSCKKTFNSEVGLQAHTKAKHSGK